MAGSGNTFHFQNYPSPIDTTTYLPSFEIIPLNIHHTNNPITTTTTTATATATATAVESPSKKQKTNPSSNNNNNKNGTPKVFQCQFCPRKYGSYKALGGHQNAHRRERAAIRAVASLSLSSPWPSVSPAKDNVQHGYDQQYYGYGYGYGYGNGENNEGYFGNVVDGNVISFSAPPMKDVFHGGYAGGGCEGSFMMMGFDQGVAPSLSPSHHHEVIIKNNEDGGGLNLDLTLGTFN